MRRILPFLNDLLFRTARLVRFDTPFYLFIAVYTIASLLFLYLVGASDKAAFAAYLWRWPFMFGFFLPAIALGADAALLATRFRRRPKLAAKRLFSPSRMAYLLSGLVLLMAFGVFQGDFTSVKNGLPVWRGGFVYDTAQADLDALLHFGSDPWHFLHRIGGFDIVRTVVEWNYNILWFLICFGALFFVATSPMAAHIRSRYLICFAAIWVVIGNIFAGVFLSAGPAFYGFVTGDAARFGEQLAFLAHGGTNPNSAAAYQNYLWTLYDQGQAGFASGISAFPSVHVALITLNALFIYEHHRKLGLAAFGYVLFVAASSVYLAWHYAIDGYAAMVITAAIYFAVRKWRALAGFRQEGVHSRPAPDTVRVSVP
ncbi:phosphatase PAP2 family protein [Mesorhizobium sp. PUT5]|uniref:phosphatase PAP2 family protein n=1 Tax=Mesorhizobium sp. PUT5 TaxID=3454629 RepID=UPI003FA443A9